MTSLAVMLLLGRNQCFGEAAALTTLATLLSSLLATVCRLLFKWARLSSDQRYRAAYSAHKLAYQAALVLHDAPCSPKGKANLPAGLQTSAGIIRRQDTTPFSSPPPSPPQPVRRDHSRWTQMYHPPSL